MKFTTTFFSGFCVLLFATCQSATASVIWDYSSTDGVDVVSGTLTTGDGSLGLDAVGSTYLLESIDTVFLNGVNLDSSFSGVFGGLPFTFSPSGSISGLGGGAADLPFLGSVRAFAVGGGNAVFLSAPTLPSTTVRFSAGLTNIASFTPISTTFSLVDGMAMGSAVPEPRSAVLLLLAACLGAVGYRRQQKKTQPNSASA